MGFKNSDSDYSEEIYSKNNYIYDGYGFLLVNSVEDLLYDKFNDCMENFIDVQQNKNNKKKETEKNKSNFNIKYQSNSSKRKMGIYMNYNNNINKLKNYHKDKSRSMIMGLTKEKNNLLKNNKIPSSCDKNYYINSKNNNSNNSIINKDNTNFTDKFNFNNKANKNKAKYIKNRYNDNGDNYIIEKNNFKIGNNNIMDENEKFLIKSDIKNYDINNKYKYDKDKQEDKIFEYKSIPFQQRFIINNNTDNKNNTKYDQEEAFTFGGEKNEGDLNINLNSNNINNDSSDEKIITFNNLSKSIDSKSHIRIKKNYEKDDDVISFKYDENKTKKNKIEKGNKKNVDNLDNIKYNKENKRISYNIPHKSICYITKIKKDNNFIMKLEKIVPKKKRIFITKKYSSIKNDSNKKDKKLLILPKSTICYFQRNNIIININTHLKLQTIVNHHFFVTKEISNYNNKVIKKKKENNICIINKKQIDKIPNRLKVNNKSNNISVKLENHKKQSFLLSNKNENNNLQTSRYEISCNDLKKINKSNSIIYPSIERRENNNEGKYDKNIGLIIKNHMIRKALNKSNKKKKNIKIIKLKTKPENQIFDDKCTEKKLTKGFKIPIKNKFKNNMINKFKMFDLVRNSSKNMISPSEDKKYSEKNKNKSISYIKEQNYENYLFFPAINTYFNS